MASFCIGKTIILLKKLGEVRIKAMYGGISNRYNCCDNPGFVRDFFFFSFSNLNFLFLELLLLLSDLGRCVGFYNVCVYLA